MGNLSHAVIPSFNHETLDGWHSPPIVEQSTPNPLLQFNNSNHNYFLHPRECKLGIVVPDCHSGYGYGNCTISLWDTIIQTQGS